MPSRERKSRSSASPSGRGRSAGGEGGAPSLRQVPLAEMKDDFSRYLRLASRERIVITRHGQPAGVLIGFASPDDWFAYRLAHDPAFQRRVAELSAAAGEAATPRPR